MRIVLQSSSPAPVGSAYSFCLGDDRWYSRVPVLVAPLSMCDEKRGIFPKEILYLHFIFYIFFLNEGKKREKIGHARHKVLEVCHTLH